MLEAYILPETSSVSSPLPTPPSPSLVLSEFPIPCRILLRIGPFPRLYRRRRSISAGLYHFESVRLVGRES